MLLATQYGLFCLLEPRPDVYHVLCGSRQDLNRLLRQTDVDARINSSDDAEPCYWVEVELDEALELVVQMSAEIHYADFRLKLAESPDQRRALAMYEPLLERAGHVKPVASSG